jgi:hypothetical protein
VTTAPIPGVCEHGIELGGCELCNALICVHDKYFETCEICNAVCEHGIYRNNCDICFNSIPPLGEPYCLGDVTGSGEPSIGGVLEILKYLAGMKNTLDGNTAALRAANITQDGSAPAIGDVLEILKYLAGMKNAIYNP